MVDKQAWRKGLIQELYLLRKELIEKRIDTGAVLTDIRRHREGI